MIRCSALFIAARGEAARLGKTRRHSPSRLTPFSLAAQTSAKNKGGKIRWLYSKYTDGARQLQGKPMPKHGQQKFPRHQSPVTHTYPENRQESERTTLQGEKIRASFFRAPELVLGYRP